MLRTRLIVGTLCLVPGCYVGLPPLGEGETDALTDGVEAGSGDAAAVGDGGPVSGADGGADGAADNGVGDGLDDGADGLGDDGLGSDGGGAGSDSGGSGSDGGGAVSDGGGAGSDGGGEGGAGVCGDGVVGPGEACDDGNANDTDSCSNQCQAQSGDGLPNNAYCNAVSDWNASWVTWEMQVLSLVNEARSTPTNCHTEGNFNAAPPLTYNAALTCSARNHSADMGDNNFFSHTNLAGENPAVRIGYAGYDWSTWGENIAAGQNSPQAVVTGWLASDGHCANLMNPAFEELGVGYYNAPGSMYTHYWSQNFGAPG